MTVKKNVPKLRFPDFTGEWEQRKLSELIVEYKETVESDCTLPVLTSSKTEGVILQEEHFGRKQNHDITGYNVLPRNYCTYRNRSDGVDFTFNINKCCDKGIISKFYPVFCGNNSDIFFISLVLNNSDEVVREIGYTCTGTGQKVLSFLNLQKMYIRVPKYDEQKMIAAFFEHLDDLITLYQHKLDEIKEYKAGLLQKMFPQPGEVAPELRFPGFTGPWEQRKVVDVAPLQRGFDLPATQMEEGPYPVVMSNGIGGHHTAFKVKGPGVVTGRSGTIGKLHYIEDDYWPHNTALWVTNFKGNLPKFVYYLYQRLDLSSFGSGSGVPTLNRNDVHDAIVFIPSIDEQMRISDSLDRLDTLITLHQRKLDELKKYKQGLQQQMFV